MPLNKETKPSNLQFNTHCCFHHTKQFFFGIFLSLSPLSSPSWWYPSLRTCLSHLVCFSLYITACDPQQTSHRLVTNQFPTDQVQLLTLLIHLRWNLITPPEHQLSSLCILLELEPDCLTPPQSSNSEDLTISSCFWRWHFTPSACATDSCTKISLI